MGSVGTTLREIWSQALAAPVPTRLRASLHARSFSFAERLHIRSVVFVRHLPASIERAIPIWIAAFLALATMRIATSPTYPATLSQFLEIFVPYALIALSPALAWRLAMAAFPPDRPIHRSRFTLARIGRWRNVSRLEARDFAQFGPFGFMASLMIGMLLNVPIRAGEFLLAVPAIDSMAPAWGRTIFLVMAFDVFAMSFLYVTCFVMALRTIPLFPRMLAFAWVIDISLQLIIAQSVARHADLPADVGVALGDLLSGNVSKVLVSVAVWLPYLLLSERINVTYRARVSAPRD